MTSPHYDVDRENVKNIILLYLLLPQKCCMHLSCTSNDNLSINKLMH